ncbi:MAG: hypothetical protein HW421_2896 [Ignavibacteria bacterium]|nr:hypothetical protein [Ignavibacteria bacterium]
MVRKYSKILVGKFSEPNKCYVQDGVPLFVKPLKSFKNNNPKSIIFISLIDFKTKSKFGWVKVIDEFSLEEYFEDYFQEKKLSENEIHAIKTMLSSIDKLDSETPVAAT